MKINPIITTNITKNARKLATAAMFTAATLGMTSSLVSCNNNKQDNTQTELISKEASQAQQAYTGINVKDLQSQTNIQSHLSKELNNSLFDKYNKTGYLDDKTSILDHNKVGTYASAIHMSTLYNYNMYKDLFSPSNFDFYDEKKDPAILPKADFKKKLISLKYYNKNLAKTFRNELEALAKANATYDLYNTYLDNKFAEIFINYDLEDDFQKRLKAYKSDKNNSINIEQSNFLAYQLDILYTYKMCCKAKELGLENDYPSARTHFYYSPLKKLNSLHNISEWQVGFPKIFTNLSTPPQFMPNIKDFVDARNLAKSLGLGETANGYFLPSITAEMIENLVKQKGSYAAQIDLTALYNYFVFDKVILKEMEKEYKNTKKEGKENLLTENEFKTLMQDLKKFNEDLYQLIIDKTSELSRAGATWDDYNSELFDAPTDFDIAKICKEIGSKVPDCYKRIGNGERYFWAELEKLTTLTHLVYYQGFVNHASQYQGAKIINAAKSVLLSEYSLIMKPECYPPFNKDNQ